MFKLQVEKETTLLFHTAFKYFAVKLGLTQEELNLISVTIENRKKLGSRLSSDSHGACVGVYRDEELHRVEIFIKAQSDLGLIDTLAHEMVHAKQNLKGEFSFSYKEVPFMYFFKARVPVKIHSGQILSETPYYEQKCEQEAFTKSREMVRQFLNFFYHLENSDVEQIRTMLDINGGF